MRVLEGRVAVVTGAAGGIGRAIALELARNGMDLVLADVDEAGMSAVAAEITRLGRRALAVPTDVGQKASVESLLARTLKELGSCHVIVNNAGVFNGGTILAASDEQWQRVIDINLWGVVHGSRVFAAHFAQQGEGHVVNTASTGGLFPAPGMCSYSTTKYAIVGFTHQLRWELAPTGVGVTVLCPGIVRTRIGSRPGVGLDHIDFDNIIRNTPRPEGLARKVVRAVRKNQPVVRYGAGTYFVAFLGVLPVWLTDPIGRFMARRAAELTAPPAPKALP